MCVCLRELLVRRCVCCFTLLEQGRWWRWRQERWRWCPARGRAVHHLFRPATRRAAAGLRAHVHLPAVLQRDAEGRRQGQVGLPHLPPESPQGGCVCVIFVGVSVLVSPFDTRWCRRTGRTSCGVCEKGAATSRGAHVTSTQKQLCTVSHTKLVTVAPGGNGSGSGGSGSSGSAGVLRGEVVLRCCLW